MDDFFSTKRSEKGFKDPFFDDDYGGFFSPNRHQFDNPFFGLHHSMAQIHRDMDDMMRHAFSSFNHPFHHPFNSQPSIAPSHPSNQQPQITNPKDRDLDKQVQQYGLDNILNDNSYLSDWDFVKQLEKLEKMPNSLNPSDSSSQQPNYYGRTHVYNYRSTGDGKIEERKMVQDSKGNRMESIKRQIDDKLWARTVRRNENGEMNEDEKLMNMDDNDKEKFVNDWRSNDRRRNVVKSINAQPDQVNHSDVNPITLPSLSEPQNKQQSSWTDKLKFWK